MGARTAARRLIRTFQEVRQRKSVYQRIREYRPRIPLHYESDEFRIVTAQSSDELMQVLQLRHQIFIEEWQGRSLPLGLDVDDHDFVADHLMIIDKRSEKPVGTYRLLSSQFTDLFYSCGEFGMGEFLKSPGTKLEMGRACIHADYRNGNTINLLWKGLAHYIEESGTEYLFGCSSVKTTDPALISALYRTLHADQLWSDQFHIRPTPDYHFPGFLIAAEPELTAHQKRELIPPLLRSYLHAGAHVYGWPALDREFACTDLLTILDWSRLKPKFRARYMVRT